MAGGHRAFSPRAQVVALVNYMSQILVELIKLANLIITITKALACMNRVDGVFWHQPPPVSSGQAALRLKTSEGRGNAPCGGV